MIREAACALLAGVMLGLGVAVAEDDYPVLVGIVSRVADGDTIDVRLQSGTIRVRLDSIDAPERDQPHGAESRAALARLVARRAVELEVVTQDQYDRLVAVVYVDDINVNERLVRDGHAWAYRRFLTDHDFCRWEDAARRARKGLWSLPERTWIYPSDWRQWRRRQIEFVRDFSSETAARCIAAIGAD